MLRHVLHSPVPFFDVTPQGRIMNRFSVDLDAIDNRLYLNAKQFLQNALHTVARLILVGTQAPYVVLVGAVFGGALVFLMVSSLLQLNRGKYVSKAILVMFPQNSRSPRKHFIQSCTR